MAIDEMYMENLDECVNDENKVVTYKWLSRTLGVHVNQAKQMLFWFVHQQRNQKDNDSLNVTYLVAGTIKGEGQEKCTKVLIVPEVNLEATKAKFDSLTSCHVYSVQRTALRNTNSLYMVDYEKLKENVHNTSRYSAILCKKAQARSADEIEELRTVAQPTSSAPNFVKGSNKQQNGTSSGKKPADIAGMFANTAKKIEKKAPEAETNKESAPQAEKKTDVEAKQAEIYPKATLQKPTEKQKKGVMAFFGNQANKPKAKTSKKDSPAQKPNIMSEEAKPIVTDEDKEEEVAQKTKSVTKASLSSARSKKPKATSARGKKKKQTDSDDENNTQKKRRRLQEQMWSDSSSDEEMETMPESPVPSPPRDPTPPTKEASSESEDVVEVIEAETATGAGTTSGPTQHRRKRVRKLKNKTFMGEDGFLVTEKVYESESTDASEVEEVPKPAAKPKPAQASPVKAKQQGKKKSPQKKSPDSKASKKQTALTSFFKKK